MAALLCVLVAIFLSLRVLVILKFSIVKAPQARLFNFCGRREQDAPQTFPGQPPKSRGMSMVQGTPPFRVSALRSECGAGRGTQPIQARPASAGGSHPEGRNGARNERSGGPALARVDCRPRERYAHTEVAAP